MRINHYNKTINFIMSVKQEQNGNAKRIRHDYYSQLICKSGNRVEKFCKNDDCRFDAFCCMEEDCFTCNSDHQGCVFGEFSQLIKKIDARFSFENNIKMKLFAIQGQIVEQLKVSRREIQEKKFLWESNTVLKRINELFFEGKRTELCGADINDIFQNLTIETTEKTTEERIRKYQKEIHSLTQSILETRDRLLDTILSPGNRQTIQEKINLSQLKQEHMLDKQGAMIAKVKLNDKESQYIDSLILRNNPEKESMINFIIQELGNPSQLKLLFRASQHNYRSQAFHSACNNIKNTFTLVLTEYNKIFAGFTPLEWTSNGFYIPDPSLSSFLLHLNLREKMALKYPKRAIYDHSHKGPSFGTGDILIGDKCNIDANNSANFPFSYQGAHKYKREDQSSWTMFSGAKFGKKFNVLEYEVYEVIK